MAHCRVAKELHVGSTTGAEYFQSAQSDAVMTAYISFESGVPQSEMILATDFVTAQDNMQKVICVPVDSLHAASAVAPGAVV
jgi:hypothetical protein